MKEREDLILVKILETEQISHRMRDIKSSSDIVKGIGGSAWKYLFWLPRAQPLYASVSISEQGQLCRPSRRWKGKPGTNTCDRGYSYLLLFLNRKGLSHFSLVFYPVSGRPMNKNPMEKVGRRSWKTYPSGVPPHSTERSSTTGSPMARWVTEGSQGIS